MKPRNLFAYDKSGSVIVTAHGAELIVASGSDGAPLWKKKCNAEIVGVGSTEEEVVSLDIEGNLVWWNADNGAENDRITLKGKPVWLAVDVDGVAAVISGGAVRIMDPGDKPRTLDVEGARRVAWSPDGSRFAVGTRGGLVRVVDEETLEELGSSELGASITSLAFGETALYATAGAKLYKLDEEGEGAEPVRLAQRELEGTPEWVSCSQDGEILAFRVGSDAALVQSAEGELIAVARVSGRELASLALGPRPWLGVAGERGEAARVNLRTGAVKQVQRGGEPDSERSDLPLELELKSALVPRKKKEAKAKPLPRTEREVNAPDWQTLTYLGVVAAMSLVLWGSMRFACNAHPPTSLKPREVGTVELASTPKDAAIEMFQRLELKDYDGALELVKGQSQQLVEKAKEACGSDMARCETDKKARAGNVLTTADLISRGANTAKAKVTSLVKGEPAKTYDVELEQDGPIWKVVRHAPIG